MAADNQTTIVGNLVETPELRFTNNGIAVANLHVAVTQRIQHHGKWRDGDTSYLRVNVWRGQAEHLADSLSKGDRVMVTGRLRQRSWETPEGERRSGPSAAATSTTLRRLIEWRVGALGLQPVGSRVPAGRSTNAAATQAWVGSRMVVRSCRHPNGSGSTEDCPGPKSACPPRCSCPS
jgi:single stranded DNA-binding protein